MEEELIDIDDNVDIDNVISKTNPVNSPTTEEQKKNLPKKKCSLLII